MSRWKTTSLPLLLLKFSRKMNFVLLESMIPNKNVCLPGVVNSAPQIQLSGNRQVLGTFFREIASYHCITWFTVAHGGWEAPSGSF